MTSLRCSELGLNSGRPVGRVCISFSGFGVRTRDLELMQVIALLWTVERGHAPSIGTERVAGQGVPYSGFGRRVSGELVIDTIIWIGVVSM